MVLGIAIKKYLFNIDHLFIHREVITSFTIQH